MNSSDKRSTLNEIERAIIESKFKSQKDTRFNINFLSQINNLTLQKISDKSLKDYQNLKNEENDNIENKIKQELKKYFDISFGERKGSRISIITSFAKEYFKHNAKIKPEYEEINIDDFSIIVASIVEIFHELSLIIDDFIDSDTERRDQKTFLFIGVNKNIVVIATEEKIIFKF